MTPEHKQEVLRHCLWMAERDAEYAVEAAGWYEANEPQLLANLQAKVRQQVRRATSQATRDTSADANPSDGGSHA